jgi:hypothetical protein
LTDGGNAAVALVAFGDAGVVASAKVVVVTAGAGAPVVVDPSPAVTWYPCEAVAFFSCVVPNTPIPAISDIPITDIKPVIAVAEPFRCLNENCTKWLYAPTMEIILSFGP